MAETGNCLLGCVLCTDCKTVQIQHLLVLEEPINKWALTLTAGCSVSQHSSSSFVNLYTIESQTLEKQQNIPFCVQVDLVLEQTDGLIGQETKGSYLSTAATWLGQPQW